MQDTTVFGMPRASKSAAIMWHQTAGNAPGHAEDNLLARLLIISWMLATGRTLRTGIPPQLLSTEELISFWADDLMTADLAAPVAAP
jgi:hypothetical protein